MAIFITFEGIDGSGKSTQIRLLSEFFAAKQIGAIITREPGGTPIAEQLRTIILSGEYKFDDALTELLLILAGRRDHYLQVIKPSLTDGKHVICDRFSDSSLIYQGIIKGLGVEYVRNFIEGVLPKITPDLTFLLDLDPKFSLERMGHREEQANAYDRLSLNHHTRIREGFLALAKEDPNRIKVINAHQDPQDVHKDIVKIITEMLQSGK